jgi:hypothetical protein
MVMDADEARNQERLCWRRPAVIYYFAFSWQNILQSLYKLMNITLTKLLMADAKLNPSEISVSLRVKTVAWNNDLCTEL